MDLDEKIKLLEDAITNADLVRVGNKHVAAPVMIVGEVFHCMVGGRRYELDINQWDFEVID